MRKIYLILFVVMLVCMGCEWRLRPNGHAEELQVSVDRFDRVEALYLTTGDLAALHQMNTDYPQQTRLLIENLLQLGHVNDSGINARFLMYYQDSTLQRLVADVESVYTDMNDVDEQLGMAFRQLRNLLPDIEIPHVYAQISSLDQSIVVGDGVLGISLDKYLGEEYPVYNKYGYTERQRATMTRSNIVPDCLSFYLLSLYPLPAEQDTVQAYRYRHMGRIQYVVNQAIGTPFFDNEYVSEAEELMNQHEGMTFGQLLQDTDR